MSSLPDLTAIDLQSLTAALRRGGLLQDGRVAGINVDGLRDTILSRVARLHLTYDGSTWLAPNSVFLKSALPERPADLWRGYRHETEFYRNVAPRLAKGVVPGCFQAHFDETTKDFQLLLEDLTETHALLQTPWPLPPTAEECRLLLSAWANFHAAWWNAPELGVAIGTWTETFDQQMQDFQQRFEQFDRQLGERLSPERRYIYIRLIDNADRLHARYHSRRDMTIVHGDAHPWNVLLPNRAGDSARIIDWDCWRLDVATDDISYMMAMHWFPDYRRRFERDMLDFYHDELLRHGVTGYDRRALWDDYRLSTLWHIVTPLYQCTGKLPPLIWWNHLDRIFSAVEDLDCRELLA